MPERGRRVPAAVRRLALAVVVVVAVSVTVTLGLGGVADPGGTASRAPSVAAAASPSASASPSGSPSGSPSASPSTSPTPRGPLTLVGVGDSVPSADTCGCASYVEQVGARLGTLTGRRWVVHNDATGGWTTADVEGDLTASPTSSHLADADLVVVEVGANDFDLDRVDDPDCLPAADAGCWSATLADLRDGLTRIIAGIRRVDHRPDLRIALLGYWNVTVDGAVGRALGEDFVLGSDALTRLVNDTVQQVSVATGTDYVDAYTPLKGPSGTRDPTGDLLDDGDHPNASGHTLLAQAVVGRLVADGAVATWRSAP